MTFTYDTSLGTTLSKVRLLIGDTDSSNPLLTDEEINYFISLDSNAYGAAGKAAMAISGKYARRVDTKVESVSVANGKLAEQYASLANRLFEQKTTSAGGAPTPFVGGVSVAAMDAADALTDRPASRFKVGMLNNPPNGTSEDY